MYDFHHAETSEDLGVVRELWREYLGWVNLELDKAFGIRFDVKAKVEQDMTELGMFSPPDGRLVLAELGSAVVGLGCLRRIGPELGEIKRMYVRPQFRGRGVGRALLDYLLEQGRKNGFRSIRLDSVRFMEAAQSLYRSCGFMEIDPYPESEIPKDFQEHWVFLEIDLQAGV